MAFQKSSGGFYRRTNKLGRLTCLRLTAPVTVGAFCCSTHNQSGDMVELCSAERSGWAAMTMATAVVAATPW